jgi:hypothetical protein
MRNPKLSRRGSMARQHGSLGTPDLFKMHEQAGTGRLAPKFERRLKAVQFQLEQSQNLGLAVFPPSSKD